MSEVIHVLLSPSWQMLGQYFKIGHHNFVPHPSQLILYKHLVIRYTTFIVVKASLNKPRNQNLLFSYRGL